MKPLCQHILSRVAWSIALRALTVASVPTSLASAVDDFRFHENSGRPTSSVPGTVTVWKPPVTAASWPILFKKKPKQPVVNDPFGVPGAEQQRALAEQLRPPSGSATPLQSPNGLPDSQVANAAPAVAPPSAAALAGANASTSYPWPAPVDTHADRTQAVNPAIDQSIWGPTATPRPAQGTAPPAVSPPPSTASLQPLPPVGASIQSAAYDRAAAPVVANVSAAKRAAPPPSPPTPPAPPDEEVNPTQVLAIVGNQPILAGDLLGPINQMLEPYLSQMEPWQIADQRQKLLQMNLPDLIKNKLLFLDALRTVPSENMGRIEQNVRKAFQEEQMPELLKTHKAQSIAELDEKLRQSGSSLAREERAHFERVVARDWLRTKVKFEQEVTPDQLLEEYRARKNDYHHPARVRWERLMVRYRPDRPREAAMQAIARMGDEILGGAPFDAVARKHSECPNAALGGRYEWTRQGSLASKQLDAVLFSIPVGQLSRILDDEEGCHIVRVLEREPEGFVPFTEVQEKLREELVQKRFQKAVEEVLAKLGDDIPVWTVYDAEPPASNPVMAQQPDAPAIR